MTPNHRRQWQGFAVSMTTLAASVLLAAALALGMHGVRAQGEGAAELHPAHIHVGTCDALDPNPTHMVTDMALASTASEAQETSRPPLV